MHKRTKEASEKKRINDLKTLFKRVVRIVSLNNTWIEYENEEEQSVWFKVKKNISFRERSTRKPGILTSAEKSIIRTPHESRTIPQRRKLCSLFATLRCFSILTPKLRARLVPVVRLLPINPGRNIISESDVPITVFFILMGEVCMIKGEDMNGNEQVDGIFGPGDIIGDVELLEGCARRHTFKATTYCELLVLFDYDFVETLGPYMTKIWDEKKRALKALDYFDFLDNDQIVEACRFSTLKQFNPLDTIHYEEVGSLTNVHFVLSGECLILQCLNMALTKKKGKRVFELMSADDDNISRMLRQGVRSTFSGLSRRVEEASSKTDITRLLASSSSSSSDKDPNSLKTLMRKMNLRDIEKACGLIKELAPTRSRLTWHRRSRISVAIQNKLMDSEDYQDFIEEENDYWEPWDDSNNYSISGSRDSDDFRVEITDPFRNTTHFEPNQVDENEYFYSSNSSSFSSSDDMKDAIYDSHFIDVGSITFGGIFGLGENMKHRVIMARTTVQCLTLPRFFLLEKKQNPGNIWERRLFYLECMIPSREALFEQFLKNREWKKFKKDFIRQSVKPSVNSATHIEDIPIICRIVESPDDVN